MMMMMHRIVQQQAFGLSCLCAGACVNRLSIIVATVVSHVLTQPFSVENGALEVVKSS
jgi:hypothetical protein